MLLLPPPRCEDCGSVDGSVMMHTAYTAYVRPLTPFEERVHETIWRLGQGGMPPSAVHDEVANRDRSLCDSCAELDAIGWQERWDEYRGGLL